MIIKLKGNTAVLSYHFESHFPTNELKVGLLGFYSTNLINNITNKNNKIYYNGTSLSVPEGRYNYATLREYLNRYGFDLIIRGNQIEINSLYVITERSDSLSHFLNTTKKFIPVETINVHCNLAHGMLVQGGMFAHRETDIISCFKMNVNFNNPIIYEPTPIYYSIQYNNIYKVELRICDENDQLIDFNGADITVVLELK